MNRIKELEALILKHKALYYQGRPEISDFDYDAIEDELKKIDPENPVLKVVGTAKTSGKKIGHAQKMLSLEKTYDEKDLVEWISDRDVISTLKIDGMSGSLIYEAGKLILGKTRGDGSVGEEITEKVLWIESVPKEISHQGNIEIRGEIFCLEDSFFRLSEEMAKIGLERPTSPRNIVAGLIGRKENIELCRMLSFRPFDLISDDVDLAFDHEKFDLFREFGFELPDYAIHKKGEAIQSRIEFTKSFMNDGEYQIDGLVFTYDDLRLHRELGETAHHPRYKLAFKFKGESKETIINEIEWGVSRNGVLTPVALVEPVSLSGAMISRVTLHNYGQVATFKLKKGDRIEIVRSGEVIPKFLSVIESSENEFVIPKNCPSCGGDVSQVEIRLYCQNSECIGRNQESILNFIQKIGIDDLSTKRLLEMMKKGLVKRVPDLYRLEISDLLTLDKTKEKMAAKLYESIQKTKSVDLITFLSALGISGGAYNKCEKVVQAGFDTIEKLLQMSIEDLIKVNSFAQRSAEEFVSSLQEKSTLIRELLLLGVKIKEAASTGALHGMKICITGSLSEKRTVIEKRIREAGGVVVSGVSKETDYLLTNDATSGSTKAEKAKELGVKIISEEALLKII